MNNIKKASIVILSVGLVLGIGTASAAIQIIQQQLVPKHTIIQVIDTPHLQQDNPHHGQGKQQTALNHM